MKITMKAYLPVIKDAHQEIALSPFGTVYQAENWLDHVRGMAKMIPHIRATPRIDVYEASFEIPYDFDHFWMREDAE